MNEKSESERLETNSENNYSVDLVNPVKNAEANNVVVQETSQTEKVDKFPWQLTENVKRDSFGFILRTDPLPLNVEKSKKSDSQEDLNFDSGKSKTDKGKNEDRFEDGRKSERERGRDRDRDKRRDRDRSPHGYKRK